MRRSLSELLPLLFAVLLIVGVGYDALRRLEVSTSMEHFLPGQGEKKLYRVSRKLIDTTLTGRMVLTLGIDDTSLSREARRDRVTHAAREWGQALRQIEGFSSITQGPPEGIGEAFFEIYFPRRFAYFSLTPEHRAKERFSDAGLSESAERLKQKMGSAEGVLLRNLASRDPWLLFYDFLKEAEGSSLTLDVHEGQFFARSNAVSSDQDSNSPEAAEPNETGASSDFAILFAKLRDSALNSTTQEPLLRALRSSFNDVNARYGNVLILEASGANRFAVATEKSLKSDIERVFSLSTLSLVALFLLLFRSVLRLVFLILPIFIGLLSALWVTLLVGGQIHALTLAFGGALIGVAIDYPVHVLCHHDLACLGAEGRRTVRRLLPTLGLAAGTTVVGLGGLAWASFPGIREIALFSAVGILTAVVSTVFLASLLPATQSPPRLTSWLSRLLDRANRAQRRKRWMPIIWLAIAASIAGLGITQVRFAPGLESLAPLDPELLQEDERVHRRVGKLSGGTLAISLGRDLEDALLTNEKVLSSLREAREEGLLGGFENVATLLRSESLQTRSHRVVTTEKDLAERTLRSLVSAGFVGDGFPQLEDELRGVLTPLTLSELERGPVAPLVEPFVFEVGGEIAVITPLFDIQDEPNLAKKIEKTAGAHYFSQRALLNSAYGDLRARTTQLLLVGFFLVWLMAFTRYRNLRRATGALVPSLLAASATVGILALSGVELNLLHILGLLLVCSMGVDYSIILIDAEDHHAGHALLSITIGCASTMLSFGALALSSAPALRALGVTIAVGIVLSLLTAPTALLIAGSGRKASA